ncbi:hypothetical protein [Limibacterium fermenti]|uniref:hypothetical protein n=1 Tax=Limibacterium fermenti TaxID=3229863 RepID=UPI003A6059C2
MEEILKNNRWFHYRTGCACVGLPRYWRNEERPGWTVVIRGNMYSINENNCQVARGTEIDFETKMRKLNLIPS